MKLAFVMDPISQISYKKDSTLAMMVEAQEKGHEIFYIEPDCLFFNADKPCAEFSPISVKYEESSWYEKGENTISSLDFFDAILMRQDPPFNMAYISATHILEKLSSSTLIVNNPFEVRNSPEKIFVTNFSHLMPKTLISRNIDAIKEFRNQFKDIIIKPLYGNGGQGVFHILPEDENLNSILEMFFIQNKEPLMIQEYLKDVRNGDKRIILLNGEAVGAINRVPKSGESRSNMHVGGKPEKTELSQRKFGKSCLLES